MKGLKVLATELELGDQLLGDLDRDSNWMDSEKGDSGGCFVII